ncbi:hypothetical protein GGR65_000412 [Xanthomonas sp. 3376]|nr:hypothetical protein [Xanthomonas arboricola]
MADEEAFCPYERKPPGCYKSPFSIPESLQECCAIRRRCFLSWRITNTAIDRYNLEAIERGSFSVVWRCEAALVYA